MQDNVAAALAEAEKLVASLKAFDGTPGGHLSLLKQSDAVRRALEEPYDVMTRLLDHLSCSTALDTLLCTGAFEKLPADGSAIKAADIAAATNMDVSAVTRCYRLAIVQGFAAETAPDEYAHNTLSRVFQPPALGAAFMTIMELVRGWIRFPDYFASHAPADLFDLKKSPYAFAVGQEGKTYYEIIDMDPVKRERWNSMIQNMEKNMPVLGMFPFSSLKEQVEHEPERVFAVDVGGGLGQAMLRVEEQCPNWFGSKVVLQDLPIVISSLKNESLKGIEPMVYDVFSGPNPVKNAHIYFIRRLLHDFYNPECVKILKNTAASMGPNSRVIVCDMLVPPQVVVGEDTEVYWLDFGLMSMSGKEKTEREFHDIFGEAGLELVKIWPSGVGRTVMLEAKLKAAS